MKKKLVVVTVAEKEWCQGRSAAPETLMEGAERRGARSVASDATLSAAQTEDVKKARRKKAKKTLKNMI